MHTSSEESTTIEAESSMSARMARACLESLELFAVALGDRLGFYEMLRDGRRLTFGSMALQALVDPRYTRRWCEQQAVAGCLETETEREPYLRLYRLSRSMSSVLSDARLIARLSWLAGLSGLVDEVEQAVRDGRRVDAAVFGSHDLLTSSRDAVGFARSVNRCLATFEDTVGLGRDRRVAVLEDGPAQLTPAIASAFPQWTVHGFFQGQDAGSREREARVAVGGAVLIRGGIEELQRFAGYDSILVAPGIVLSEVVLCELRRALTANGCVLLIDADAAACGPWSETDEDSERRWRAVSRLFSCLPMDDGRRHESGELGVALRRFTSACEKQGFVRSEVLSTPDEQVRLHALYRARERARLDLEREPTGRRSSDQDPATVEYG